MGAGGSHCSRCTFVLESASVCPGQVCGKAGSQRGLSAQAAATGTAAGAGTWELAHSEAPGGAGSTGCMALVVVTPTEGMLLPSCIPVLSACAGRARSTHTGGGEGELCFPG